ncbi:MAG: hypothetical protein OXB95_12660 [Rhodobacteraceae bacterium]|nr:hypothetical protein [Paracoccaceae bacterium]
MTGLRSTTHTPLLSGVMADCLEHLINLGHPSHRRRNPRQGIARQIESAFLGGSTDVEQWR